MYVIYTPQSTEHDFEEMWNKQEAFCEGHLGNVYHSIKEHLDVFDETGQ